MAPAPTPNSTGSSSNHNSPDAQFRVVRKRNRIPLSCAPCRHRKLKCNRGHPCDNCVKRGDVQSCAYAQPTMRKKNAPNSPASNSPDEMQNRIDRLEGLVLSLMTNGPSAAGPQAAQAVIAETSQVPAGSVSGSSSALPPDTDDTIHEEMDMPDDGQEHEIDKVAKSIGVMKVDNTGKNIYISEAHWYSILAEISEVKNYFVENKKQVDDQIKRISARQEANGGGFFWMNYPAASKVEIQRSFPAKPTTDLLIARFFEIYNSDPSFQIIHGPTYQKQYDRHWASPQETDIIWVALTYAMMLIALSSYQRSGDEPPDYRGRTEQMYKDYKRLSAQSLMLGDVSHASPYFLETVILYVMADLGRSRDGETTTMLGMTMVTRMAYKMGYHRDSKYFGDVTPFNGEMRRRVWALVRHADLRISSINGMVPMIRDDVCNTDLPRNLYDDEISEDMTTLPPSRPLTEPTPMGYNIMRIKLTDIGFQIQEEVQKLGISSYEKVMALDRKLRELHESIPAGYKMRPLEESIRDVPGDIVKRFILEIQYHKTVIILHRKFSGCSRYPYSRRVCIESAMEMLQYQTMLGSEWRPGGRLQDIKFFLASLTGHDFLLAAMILAMDMYRMAETERAGRSPIDPFDGNSRPTKIALLQSSLQCWQTTTEESWESIKAVGVLTAILANLQDQESRLNNKHSPFNSNSYTSASETPEDGKLAPEHSAAMTLGMLSTGGGPITPKSAANGNNNNNNNNPGSSNNAFSQSAYDASAQTAAAQATMAQQFMDANGAVSQPQAPNVNFFGAAIFQPLDAPQNLDWDAWDSYIQSGNAMDANMGQSIWPMNLDPAMDPSSVGADMTGVTGNGLTSTSSNGQNAPTGLSSLSQQQSPGSNGSGGQHHGGSTMNNIFMTAPSQGNMI